ncbi:MAG: GNAT family N-acetyltransferase [Pseudomonadota bacterium]
MIGKPPYRAPVPLSTAHDFESFDCGHPVLNEWLRRYALLNQRANATRTFVVCQEKQVIGYYSLAVGAVDYSVASERIRKGLARHPVPVMILARLAVNGADQGKKIGQSLLKDAVMRTLQAAEFAGIRAILVQAKDERARSFYERFGFEPSPLSPFQLMIMLKDVKGILIPDTNS